jgi:hypothetical protein
MYYKYQYSFIYNWSKFKKADFSGSENDLYFGTEGVGCSGTHAPKAKSIEPIVMTQKSILFKTYAKILVKPKSLFFAKSTRRAKAFDMNT